MTLEKRSKYWNTLVDILDGQFPKGECKQRGRALIMISYIEMMLHGVEFNDEGEPLEEEKLCKDCGMYTHQCDCPPKV